MDEPGRRSPLRSLPSVHRLLASPRIRDLCDRHGRELVKDVAAALLSDARLRLRSAGAPREGAGPADLPADFAAWVDALHEAVARRLAPRLRRVINATGVVLHTNLGRAVLSEAAREAVAGVAGVFSNLEMDLETGERGSRQTHVEDLLRRLTGAEAALVVNNNAAAVLLALSALAAGREVVVSRGELVEIGGSFRIPEVMAQGGARLVEVGTTNKTRLEDYRSALGPDTALLLKVHPSNYRLVGFTEEVPLADLAALGREAGIPVMFDAGSGALLDLGRWGIRGEPVIREAVAAGADLVAFSGDKLLGGPQAGILVGRSAWIARCRRHPLARALRAGKLPLAALEATLKHYEDEGTALREVPTLRMLTAAPADLAARAEDLAGLLREAGGAGVEVDLLPGASRAGGGALPEVDLPTTLVAVAPRHLSAGAAAAALRRQDPPVLVRVAADRLLLDPRTLLPGDERLLALAFAAVMRSPTAE